MYISVHSMHMEKELQTTNSLVMASDDQLNWKTIVPNISEIDGNEEPEYIQFLYYWKGLLDLGYYFLLIPFRLEKCQDTGRLELYSNRLQQVLCAIVQVLVLHEFISLFRSINWDGSKDNNISYIQTASYLGYVAYHLSIAVTFWFKKETFRSLFHKIQNLKFYADVERKKKFTPIFIKLISYGFCTVAFILAMTDSSVVNNLYTEGNLHKFYEELSRKAKLHFLFIQNNETHSTTKVIDNCFLHQFVTIVRITILLPSLLLVPFLDIFVLMVPFSVWRIMCAFRKFCKNTAGSPMASGKILEKYWMIKKLLQELNRAIGLLLCCCVSVSLPYYAGWMGVTYFETNVHPVTLFHVYGFFLIFFVALTLSADINKKGADFFSWISSPEHTENVSTKILASLLVDLHSNQIALKGNGFFQISYRFLGTLFGIIVTYSIITIQIQLSRRVQGLSGELTLSTCNCTQG